MKFQIKKHKDGWRYQMIAANGRNIGGLTGEAIKNRVDCLHTVFRIMSDAASATIEYPGDPEFKHNAAIADDLARWHAANAGADGDDGEGLQSDYGDYDIEQPEPVDAVDVEQGYLQTDR